jgi:hypothetical protein
VTGGTTVVTVSGKGVGGAGAAAVSSGVTGGTTVVAVTGKGVGRAGAAVVAVVGEGTT